jgi:hypothetical protein
MERRCTERPALVKPERPHIGLANAGGVHQHDLEDRAKLARRPADDL